MALSDRKRRPLRITDEQASRLKRAATSRGQTSQAFLLIAMSEALEEAEAEMETRRRKGNRVRDSRDAWREGEPEGFMPAPKTPATPSPAPSAPVVVHVGAGGADAVDNISMLASYVTSGAPHDRAPRLRTVTEMLRGIFTTEESRRGAMERLQVAIAARTREPFKPAASPSLRAGEIFEMLKDYLKD